VGFRVDYPCLDWRIVSYSGIGGLRLLDPCMNQSINQSILAPTAASIASTTYRSTYSLNKPIRISIERLEIHSGMKPPSAFRS